MAAWTASWAAASRARLRGTWPAVRSPHGPHDRILPFCQTYSNLLIGSFLSAIGFAGQLSYQLRPAIHAVNSIQCVDQILREAYRLIRICLQLIWVDIEVEDIAHHFLYLPERLPKEQTINQEARCRPRLVEVDIARPAVIGCEDATRRPLARGRSHYAECGVSCTVWAGRCTLFTQPSSTVTGSHLRCACSIGMRHSWQMLIA
jgi:hypothetical protein